MRQKGQRQLVRIEERGHYSAVSTPLNGSSVVGQGMLDKKRIKECTVFITVPTSVPAVATAAVHVWYFKLSLFLRLPVSQSCKQK